MLSGSVAWWRLLSFPDGLCCIGQGRDCSLGVRAVPFFAGRVASTPIMGGMFVRGSGFAWFYAIG